jgi:hypothetical protein
MLSHMFYCSQPWRIFIPARSDVRIQIPRVKAAIFVCQRVSEVVKLVVTIT